MAKPPLSPAVPRHVAIIMDGNGRWAKQHHLPRLSGHEAGRKSVKQVVQAAIDHGVKYLTLYAFSVENWQRPREEVQGLMGLLRGVIREELNEMGKEGIRLRTIGRRQDLPEAVREELEAAIEKTQNHTRLDLILALSYGSRVEITEAVQSIAREVKAGSLDPEKIKEETVSLHLYTKDIPDPDLLIRTSGEMRVSNFLLWQISYAEIHVTPVLWPDFGKKEFGEALADYARRERRFGGL
ncbi:MAG: isoprenyl transferase [Verrucomicrobia bacterium]|jgi:undecaprenyl diphosphate synthase|nr:isoprenyl transferase [Verrucomicrobiota bacterium]